MTSLLDTVVRRGEKSGRIAAVHRNPHYNGSRPVGWVTPDWLFLVVCEGRFEEWRADECSPTHAFDRPVAPVPPPTRASVGPYCPCSNGCKRPECDRL